MKHLSELINLQEPGWGLVEEWMKEAANDITILSKDKSCAEEELYKLQITTRSPMGAVVYETGGILIDHGWIRVLGSGHARLNRGMAQWNIGKTIAAEGTPPGFLLIADDAVGGYFAINGGALGDDKGNVYYLAPDTLDWESLGFGYSDFLYWLFCGNIQKFYETFKWKTWQHDLSTIDGNQVFAFYPFLFTQYNDIEALQRSIITVSEHYKFITETSEWFKKKQ